MIDDLQFLILLSLPPQYLFMQCSLYTQRPLCKHSVNLTASPAYILICYFVFLFVLDCQFLWNGVLLYSQVWPVMCMAYPAWNFMAILLPPKSWAYKYAPSQLVLFLLPAPLLSFIFPPFCAWDNLKVQSQYCFLNKARSITLTGGCSGHMITFLNSRKTCPQRIHTIALSSMYPQSPAPCWTC